MQNIAIAELVINPEEIVYSSMAHLSDELWIGVARQNNNAC